MEYTSDIEPYINLIYAAFHGPGSGRSLIRLQNKQKRQQVKQLRTNGLSYSEIGEAVGISRQSAWYYAKSNG